MKSVKRYHVKVTLINGGSFYDGHYGYSRKKKAVEQAQAFAKFPSMVDFVEVEDMKKDMMTVYYETEREV